MGALAVVGAGVVAAGFLAKTIGGASDLAEAQSKVGVVFGKSAAQIVTASNSSARAMGLSKGAYLDAAGSLGNLLVSLDIAPKAAAGMSQKMVKLAADMASFNNVPVEDALLAIRSGLTGETEPLKRFGVNMNEATLKAQAMKMGLIKTTTQALTPQQKALAAQALILKQTGTAQGDFARTSGGLANQQKILSAQFQDVKDKIGTALLPIVTRFVSFLNTSVVPAISKFISGMQDGTGAGGTFAHIMAVVGDVVTAVGGFIKNTVVPYIGKLKDKFTEASGGTSGFKETLSDLKPVITVIKAVLEVLFKAILVALPILIKYWKLLAKGIGFVAKVVISLWNNVWQPILKFMVKSLGTLMVAWGKMLKTLGKVPGFGWAKTAGERMENAGRKALGMADSIKKIPDKKESKVTAKVTGKRDVDAAFNAISRVNSKRVFLDIEVRGSRAGKAAFNVGNGLLPRASGGPVSPGRTYIVGEAGPEIFTTRQRGQIIPNHQIATASGQGGQTFNVYETTNPSATAREVARRMAFA